MRITKRNAPIYVGLLVIVAGFYITLFLVDDLNNDSFWYTRQYTVIQKIPGEHTYKGNIEKDYYLKIKYLDSNSYAIESVSVSNYYLLNENATYTKRYIKDSYRFTRNIGFILLVIGAIILSCGLSPFML